MPVNAARLYLAIQRLFFRLSERAAPAFFQLSQNERADRHTHQA
jgi:hypothetical protein